VAAHYENDKIAPQKREQNEGYGPDARYRYQHGCDIQQEQNPIGENAIVRGFAFSKCGSNFFFSLEMQTRSELRHDTRSPSGKDTSIAPAISSKLPLRRPKSIG
jgi:hypothetical protein